MSQNEYSKSICLYLTILLRYVGKKPYALCWPLLALEYDMGLRCAVPEPDADAVMLTVVALIALVCVALPSRSRLQTGSTGLRDLAGSRKRSERLPTRASATTACRCASGAGDDESIAGNASPSGAPIAPSDRMMARDARSDMDVLKLGRLEAGALASTSGLDVRMSPSMNLIACMRRRSGQSAGPATSAGEVTIRTPWPGASLVDGADRVTELPGDFDAFGWVGHDVIVGLALGADVGKVTASVHRLGSSTHESTPLAAHHTSTRRSTYALGTADHVELLDAFTFDSAVTDVAFIASDALTHTCCFAW